jgi:hypothetical protein
MNPRRLVVLAVVGFSVGAAISAVPAGAAEPYLEFVKGLRDREYHDYALLYLEQLEKRTDVPADVKEVIPFEKAVTLLLSVEALRNPEAQMRQLDQARTYLEQFLQVSPNHPEAGVANTRLAKVVESKGKVEVLQSKSPSNVAQKGDFQKQARAHFAEARKVFEAARDRYKEAHDKFDKFIDKSKDKVRWEAREVISNNYIQALLDLAVLTYEEAQTYDRGSSENKKLLTEAANAFEKIHARYRSEVGGLYARMWQAKCFEEQDDIVKALGFYNELLQHGDGKSVPALKRLQDKVRHFRLICLNHEQRKDYQVAIQEATEWLKDNRGQSSSRVGLGIQWELVRAQEMLARKEETGDAERSKLYQQALAAARVINRFPGEYKDASTAMIQKLMVALNREPGDPKDFATAFGVAQNMVQDVQKKINQIREAKGSQQARLAGELQPMLTEAARILSLGLTLASPKDDFKDVNRARYFLAFVYLYMRDDSGTGPSSRSYDAAVVADFVARKSLVSQPDMALDAAYLAQAAYIGAYYAEDVQNRAAEIKRIIEVCNFITSNWPTSDKANDARMDVAQVYIETQQPAEAAKWLLQVPENAPQHLAAQLKAGNAYWYAYIYESIRPEAERKSKEELDGLLKQSREILHSAITRFEDQLPGELSQVDEGKLAGLTEAKLNYSSILNGSGDYQGALGMLTEGRLAVVAAIAAPGGDERNRPQKGGIKSRGFAGLVYQVVLRAYVGLQNLEKARATMHELEKIVGAGGGGAAVTKIYLDLGKELEKEVQRLQSAREPRLNEVLKSFETFLEDMFNRQEGHDFSTLIWVAETYRALGEGLEKGDPAKAENYFGKAASALQLLLDMEASKPGTIPEGAVLGVQLKLVTCKRRQKSFAEAHQMIVGILMKKSRALDVQEEAARLFEDWASRGDDLDKWDVAIEGAHAKKGKTAADKKVPIWGWVGLAEKIRGAMESNPTPEFEKQYLDASYKAAECWRQYAISQSTDKRRKDLLLQAYKSIRGTAAMMPQLGGAETWARFNSLYRSIEQDMLDLGMNEMKGKQVVDLDRRGMTKEERAAAKKAAQELAAAQAADPADREPVKKRKSKTASGAKPVATPVSGGSRTTIAAVVALLAVGGGAAYFFLVQQKKRKPRRRALVIDEPELSFDLPQAPPPEKTAKTKR